MKALLFSFIFLLAAYAGFSQGSIISVVPATGSPGQEIDIVIQAAGTNFQAGKTTVYLGDGIDVFNTDVRTRETVVARIKINQSAAPGSRNVVVNVPGEAITGADMFEVFQAGGSVTGNIDVVPVQTIYLSDFDPNNLQKSPLLFSVTIYNDMQVNDLKAELSISGEVHGDIATATKVYNKVQPGAVLRFDNRQFDSYRMASGGSNFAQSAFKSGTFPADLYTYHLKIYQNGKLVDQVEAKNPIVNQVAKPELISPGTEIGSAPDPMRVKLPLLQWFSQLPQVDVAVYPVLDGQSSAQEVTLNRPVWQQKNVTQTSIVYPSSAEVLEEGKVYAWQVIGSQQGSRGTEYFPSEVHWFVVQSATPVTSPVVQLQVDPQELSLNSGATHTFTAKGFDADNKEMDVKPQWRVVPSDGGTVDANGVFTAGKFPKTVAVIADYNGIQDYSTVTVRFVPQSSEEWMMDMFLRELFGLTSQSNR